MTKQLSLFLLLFSFTQLILAQENKESTALTWLNNNVKDIQSNQSFEMLHSRSGRSGETFRYYHTVNGVEVFDSSIAIHVSNKNQVTYHSSTFDKTVETINTSPNISDIDALNAAISELEIEGNITEQESKLYVYNKFENTKLVYRVTINAELLNGHWETIVDANTGDILSSKDIAIYENNKNPKKKIRGKKENVGFSVIKTSSISIAAEGTGMVFDPDPLTKTTSLYGGAYSDNNDQNNSELEAARTEVTLVEIDYDGALYSLISTYVEIAQIESPNTGLFQQATPDFDFTRDEQGFEAVNAFYHIDKSFRHINETLGIPLSSIYNGGVMRFDPHGLNGADNSYYSAGSLVFGEGGVDDAEDMDVVLHELGHGLHDFVTNGSLSQVNGLSEGTGDYWANSYKRSLGLWTPSDASYYYVFGWDGHNPFWPGRVTSYGATYPGGLTGSIHTDGQIWATVLLEVWEIIGRDKVDSAVLEGLAMTNSGTNQQNAAIAVRQAAIDMGYSCADIDVFTDRFEARGYVLPTFDCVACSISAIESSNLSDCDDNGTSNDPSDDFFTADITVTFDNVPATGTLDLTGDGTDSVSVSGLVSPHTFIGVTLPSDGTLIDLTATFSADGACFLNEVDAGSAPEPCSTLGMDDFENGVIAVYPNPANNSISLLNITKEYNVSVYNLLGQKVIDQKLNIDANSINISNLSIGTYLIKIQGYGEVLKFIKK